MKHVFWVLLFSFNYLWSQKEIANLPTELAESSALILIGEQFYTLNDSGNEPIVYILGMNGEIQHECLISNTENYDWETITYDGTNLFIGDIGNNNNNRKNLRVLKVNKDSVLMNSSVRAQVVNFSYQGQSEFPPSKGQLYFDAEAMVSKNDSLFIFTKNRTEPFDGISRVYYIPWSTTKKVSARYLYDLKLNPTNCMEESITDAHLCDDNLFILTYAKVYWFVWAGSNFSLQETYDFDNYTQKEGLSLDKKFFYLTDEDESIMSGGNHLYKLKR